MTREIDMWLDSYDDIFSDFDARQISKRQLSEDFLHELSRQYRENPKKEFEVTILVPKKIRDTNIEKKIKKRLHEYFRFEMGRMEKTINNRRKIGVVYLIIGILILASYSFLSWGYEMNKLIELLGFILLPGGWFFVWNSFEKFVQSPFEQKKSFEYITKMSRCRYEFFDVEEHKFQNRGIKINEN